MPRFLVVSWPADTGSLARPGRLIVSQEREDGFGANRTAANERGFQLVAPPSLRIWRCTSPPEHRSSDANGWGARVTWGKWRRANTLNARSPDRPGHLKCSFTVEEPSDPMLRSVDKATLESG